jgi:protein-S-isoprenylcysteine O-methyltransferase Ste14
VNGTLRLVAETACNTAVYAALLFVPAGTLHWWRAWVLLAALFAGMVVMRIWVFRANPALLAERRRSPLQPGQPPADKALVVAFMLVFPAYLVFIPLDVFHWHLMGRPSPVVSSLGLALSAAGWIVITLAFRENAFAAAIVKHQEERLQTVVDSGVYRFVRHPLYAGVLLATIGVALWLQSSAAVVAAAAPVALVVLRILVEEKFLRARLAGYDEYAERVSNRLLPRIW